MEESKKKSNKKKIIVIITLVLIITLAILLFLSFTSIFDTFSNGSINFEVIDSINNQLEIMRNNDAYSNASNGEKANLILSKLNSFAEDGMIDRETIIYDEDNQIISYELPGHIIACEKIDYFSDDLDNNSNITKNDNENLLEFCSAANMEQTDALILDGMTDREYVKEKCIDLANQWSTQGVNTMLDLEVTLDDMANLTDYAFVYIKMHGTYFQYKYKTNIFGYESMVSSFIVLEQKQNGKWDRKYEEDLKSHKIGYINGQYMIAPNFFNSHYQSGDFSNSILFFGCCELMGKNEISTEAWTDALNNASVAAFVGFHNTNDTRYNLDLVKTFMEQLIDGKTSKESFDFLIERYGDNEEKWRGYCLEREPAYPLLRGNENALLYWDEPLITEENESQSNTSVENSYSHENQPSNNISNHFTIQGSWKSIGSYGFGQAQPGATVTFNETNCNFYSPYDTYQFYQENGKWRLSCKNVLWQDVQYFTVTILDIDNIEIVYDGSNQKTVLQRIPY